MQYMKDKNTAHKTNSLDLSTSLPASPHFLIDNQPFTEGLDQNETRDLVRSITQAPKPVAGGEYLSQLIAYLARTLGIRYAHIAKIVNDGSNRVQVLARWANDDFAEAIVYSLKGTPCANVTNRGLCFYPADVQQHFPEDTSLVSMQVECYVGAPLVSSSGKTLGLIAIMDDKPLQNTEFAVTLISVLAQQASAELERKLFAAIHDADIARHLSLLENAPIGIWAEDYSGVKRIIDRLRDSGITDFRQYFERHPEVLFEAVETIKMISVNKAAISVYNAPSRKDFESETSYADDFATMDKFYLEEISALAEGARRVVVEHEVMSFDNSKKFSVRTMTHIPHSLDDNWSFVVSTEEDITERRNAELSLLESETRFRDFAETAADWFWETDENHMITYMSERFLDISGRNSEKIIGLTLEQQKSQGVIASDTLNILIVKFNLQRSFQNFEFDYLAVDGVKHVLSINGKPCFSSTNKFLGYRGTGQDITKAHQLSEELSYQATHDDLTSLLNRREFERRLKRSIKSSQAGQGSHAFCFLDLDQFKIINDTCGHIAGDELLRQLGSTLRTSVRKRDTLARLGGDEFGVLMEHCTLEQAKRAANQLREAISKFHFQWEGRVFHIGVSIGLVPINEMSKNIETILSMADNACYAAKDGGRNRIHIYHPDDAELALRHGEMQWLSRINNALDTDQFLLYYQPIVPISGNKQEVKHIEILLRMSDEKDKIFMPGAFLPASERYGQSIRIDQWVVSAAFKWLSCHADQLTQLSLCTINLSGASIADEEFLEFICNQHKATGVDSNKIAFEITETAAIANLPRAVGFIEALQKIGFRFALDDFGSGLSSFAYLKNLPVDFLKIDGLFVKDIADDPIGFAMVKSINEIGQLLGKQTVAEFVENDAILLKLKEIGVDYAQGYGIGIPRPIDELLTIKSDRLK